MFGPLPPSCLNVCSTGVRWGEKPLPCQIQPWEPLEGVFLGIWGLSRLFLLRSSYSSSVFLAMMTGPASVETPKPVSTCLCSAVFPSCRPQPPSFAVRFLPRESQDVLRVDKALLLNKNHVWHLEREAQKHYPLPESTRPGFVRGEGKMSPRLFESVVFVFKVLTQT